MSFLKVEEISKTYRDSASLNERFSGLKKENPVLRGLSFEVEKGEFLVLVGSTGCGKSTLLNIICGLIKQDSGHVYLDGTCIDNTPPNKREVCLVFQDCAFFPT